MTTKPTPSLRPVRMHAYYDQVRGVCADEPTRYEKANATLVPDGNDTRALAAIGRAALRYHATKGGPWKTALTGLRELNKLCSAYEKRRQSKSKKASHAR